MNERAATTWDGKPISAEPPHGAAVVVYRRSGDAVEFLILHRRAPADPAGDWAWTSPSGARLPGEPIDVCARRELLEETGLVLDLRPTEIGGSDWPVYVAEAPPDAVVVLDEEHDDFAWVPIAEAQVRCLPERVGRQIREVADALAV